MRTLLFVIAIISFTKSLANDSTKITVAALINKSTTFFNCKRSDFYKLIDTTNIDYQSKYCLNYFTILIYRDSIAFMTNKGTMSYRVVSRKQGIVEFESFEKEIALGISSCNRESFSYKLTLSINKKIFLTYDMSEYKREDLIVFEGDMVDNCCLQYLPKPSPIRFKRKYQFGNVGTSSD